MGRPGYEVLGGSVTLDGVDVLGLAPGSGPRPGCSWPCSTRPRCRACASTTCSPRRSPARGATPTATSAAILRAEAERIGFDERFLDRPLNVDLSGGEKKRNETLQLGRARARASPSSTSSTPASTSTPCGPAPAGSRRPPHETGLGVLAITHYNRLLHELQPDAVHILVRGPHRRLGGPELADELERDGYAAFAPDEAEPARRPTGPDPFADPFA